MLSHYEIATVSSHIIQPCCLIIRLPLCPLISVSSHIIQPCCHAIRLPLSSYIVCPIHTIILSSCNTLLSFYRTVIPVFFKVLLFFSFHFSFYSDFSISVSFQLLKFFSFVSVSNFSVSILLFQL